MMRIWKGLSTLILVAAVAASCGERTVLAPVAATPAPPVGLEGFYRAGAVHLSWELSSGWNQEPFRIYSKRRSDANYFLIAEVTSCSNGLCTYKDVNVSPNIRYDYYVAAVNPSTGVERPSATSIEVFVPEPVPPPIPSGLEAVALDNTIYLRWEANARNVEDFSYYKVYVSGASEDFLLGETDSEGFLDQVALNGESYSYFVTSVDDQGHESGGSGLATGTPRPDFHGEFVYAHEDQPTLSGFRFRSDESLDPIVSGTSPSRHFRLEVDQGGWYLVPGPNAQVHRNGYVTTTLKCGPAADAGCSSLDVAPATNYSAIEIAIEPQTTYVFRYDGSDGARRYGAIRVTLLGFDQNGNGLMIFDWAHQLQPGNLNLSPAGA